jgi:hypothetical protein
MVNGQQGKAAVPGNNKRQEWENSRTLKARKRNQLQGKGASQSNEDKNGQDRTQKILKLRHKKLESNTHVQKLLPRKKRTNPGKTQQSLVQ